MKSINRVTSTDDNRVLVESKIISTVSWCEVCQPAKDWLGIYSPKEKIVKSGLWLVNELYKKPFDAPGVEQLSKLIIKRKMTSGLEY